MNGDEAKHMAELCRKWHSRLPNDIKNKLEKEFGIEFADSVMSHVYKIYSGVNGTATWRDDDRYHYELLKIKPPPPPPSRVINESLLDFCPKCGSSARLKFSVYEILGRYFCINKECGHTFKSKLMSLYDKFK